MLKAQEVLDEFFDCLRKLDTSVDRCVDLFAEDGAFELPYFPTLGLPPRFKGKAELRSAFELIRSHFACFSISNIRLHEMTDTSTLWIEYHSDGLIDRTERVYAQDYASLLVVESGRIKILREYLNVISTARMILPNGLASVLEQTR